MALPARILVAEDEPDVGMLLQEILVSEGYDVQLVSSGDQLVRRAQEQPPDLIIVDLLMPSMDGLEAIRQLRNDTRTAHLPMLILTAIGESSRVVEGFETGADDYIVKPYDREVLLARVRSHLRRATQLPTRNPLTGLPGNAAIQAEIKRNLEQRTPFALMYVDLDNFKAFNDEYGFSRGDRAIHLLTSVLKEHVDPNDFLGHIGGDDFVILHFGNRPEELCERIIRAFDEQIRTLYDEADLQRGYLTAIDRYGIPRQFGIISLSIGVVTTHSRTFSDVDEMSRVAAELKHAAKQVAGSSFRIDRRSDKRAINALSDRRSGNSPDALIVCRNNIAQAAVVATLNVCGYRLLTADNEIAAQSLLASHPHPGLVVAEVVDSTSTTWWQQLNDSTLLIALASDEAASITARDAGADAVVQPGDNPLAISDQLQAAIAALHNDQNSAE